MKPGIPGNSKNLMYMNTHLSKQLFHSVIFFLFITCILFFACKQQESTSIKEKPEDNRFTKVVLALGFDEPMVMTFLHDGRVLIVERKGGLKSVDTKTNAVKTISTIPVNTKYTSKEGVVTALVPNVFSSSSVRTPSPK